MRALLVYKKSMYQLYTLERKNRRVEELLQRDDPSVSSLAAAHDVHHNAIDEVAALLRQAGYQVQRTYRARLGELAGFDLLVTVGGDGTLLDLSHHLRTDIPVLGVNSDPQRSVGMLNGATVDDLPEVLQAIRTGELSPLQVARLQLRLDGRALEILALNDVLIAHRNPAATSRYQLSVGGRTEKHMGSGLWIASAVGSTAAIRSAGGSVQPIEDDQLQFRVREPYGVRDSMLLTAGFLAPAQTLRIHSTMREGRLYIDGPHVRHDFGLGAQLEIRVEPASLSLYLGARARQRRDALAG